MVLEAPYTDPRFRILKTVFIIWASVIAVRLFYFSVINREVAFQKMETESLETGIIRAMRGRILTHDGKVLASTRRLSNLCLSTQIDSSQLNSLAEILDKELKIMRRQVMIRLANSGDKDFIILKKDLSTQEIEKVSNLFNRNKTIFVRMEFIRDYSADAKVGAVELVDGAMVGVNGFEKKYDDLLRGQDLVYEVMVDRQNRVIEKTFNEKSELVPGQDVYLSEKEWP